MRINWKPRFDVCFRWMCVRWLLMGFAGVSFSLTNPTLRSLFRAIEHDIFRFAVVNQATATPGATSDQVELSGHIGWIYSVAISPDSHTLISGGFDKTLRFWNLSRAVKAIGDSSNEKSFENASDYAFEGAIRDAHSTAISAIAVNAQQSIIATAGWDGRIKFWNLKNKDLIFTIGNAHSDDIEAIAFTPNGHQLVSVGLDNVAALWNVTTGERLKTFSSPAPIYSLAVSPNGRLLAIGNASGQILIWNLSTGDLLTSLAAHYKKAVFALAFSPDGKQFASGGADQTIRLWQTDNHLLEAELPVGAIPTALTFSPDGKRFASADQSGTVRLWQSWDGHSLQTLVDRKGAMWTVSFSPDGRAIIAAGQDKVIRVWSVQHNQSHFGL